MKRREVGLARIGTVVKIAKNEPIFGGAEGGYGHAGWRSGLRRGGGSAGAAGDERTLGPGVRGIPLAALNGAYGTECGMFTTPAPRHPEGFGGRNVGREGGRAELLTQDAKEPRRKAGGAGRRAIDNPGRLPQGGG
jgi:hypothetical protein